MKYYGTIISGYQGIGKSTLAKTDSLYFIDLESSNFFVTNSNGETFRDENWYKAYGNIALSLSEQGFDVFISSHKPVRDYIALNKNENTKLILIYPTEELQEPWIRKLQNRYITTTLDKDFKAYMGAKNYYLDNIKDLKEQEGWEKIEIDKMDYSLFGLIYKGTR